MKQTIKDFIIECVHQPDPVKYPSQVLCIAERISFTQKCEEAIERQSLSKLLNSLQNQLDKTVNVVMDEKDTSEGTKILNIKRKHMILEHIYHVRLVESLIENHVTNKDQYHWRKFLRYYLGKYLLVLFLTFIVELIDTTQIENASLLLWREAYKNILMLILN